MILLIDNYDSFSYNLYQLAGSIDPGIKVMRNDELSVEDIGRLEISHIILSPGPGRPEQAGVCLEVIRRFAAKLPMLGVCLGHQAVCEAFGAKITYAKELMHGKQSQITVDTQSRLFAGLPEKLPAARYHSLAAERDSLPEELRVTAVSDDGEIMAVEHKAYAVYGVQFHPESILTPDGEQILKNFLLPGAGKK